MKTNKISIIALVLLVVVAGYFFFSNSVETNANIEKHFAVNDTALITKVILTEIPKNQQVVLERKNEGWFLNQKYMADKKIVTALLTSVNQIQFRAPISKNSLQSVIADIQASSVKVEIFEGEKLVNSYFIGKQDEQKLGNYMMLDNSLKTYIMCNPSYSGSLRNIFNPLESFWRNKTVFAFDIQKITEIKVEISDKPEKSFQLTKTNNEFILKTLTDKAINQKINKENIKAYLSYFTQLDFEKVVENSTVLHDSLAKSKPSTIITIKSNDNKIKSIQIFQIPTAKEFDLNRIYALIDNELTVMVIKYYDLDPILKEIDYFLH